MLSAMEIKNLFDTTAFNEIRERINKLTPGAERNWGKMSVSQMLAHCKEAFKVPLSDKSMPRMFIGRLLGWMAKSKLYNDKPWGRNLPTAPNFLIKDERNFEEEKKQLLELINSFHSKGAGNVGKYPHPFFGQLNSDQWGISMWKHLDHHVKQFGV